MSRERGGSGRQATGRVGKERSWGAIVGGLIVVAVLGAFVAVVVVDIRQGPAAAPSGVEEFEGASRDHTQSPVSYEQIPPAGGDHAPVWQNQGFYEEPVRNETAVHTMEHGAVWISYDPDLPQDQKDQLREAVEDQDCVLGSPYAGLAGDIPVVATAWGRQLQLEGADDPDLENFIRSFRKGPQTPEAGATCTGGTRDTA